VSLAVSLLLWLINTFLLQHRPSSDKIPTNEMSSLAVALDMIKRRTDDAIQGSILQKYVDFTKIRRFYKNPSI
jgi:hypothetical protein